VDLPCGLVQRGAANGKHGKKREQRLQLLDPDPDPGDAQVDLLSRRSGPLVHQPEYVPETPPHLALRYDAEPHLVAHQDERHGEHSGTSQKTVELSEHFPLPHRDPQRQRIEQDSVPPWRDLQYLVEVPDLQRPPFGRPALPVETDTPLQVFIVSKESRRNV
jgi:hypothetical protein